MNKKQSLPFILLLGLVSLFGDITYEGARSILGQYLAILGASGAVVGTVAGFGELIGYGFRLVSGIISDRTGQYWVMTFVGYALNLFAVPLLAFAGNWKWAAALIILERFGKAIRSPARDALLSYATQKTGRGWGFGIHEAMDQIGAILGPLLMSIVLYFKGGYETGFALLFIPALCAMIVLIVSWRLYPHPQDLELQTPELKKKELPKIFWFYLGAISCIAAGYVDFPLIAFHFEKIGTLPQAWIPLFFSIAMAADGLAALLFGRLFDRKGFSILMLAVALSSLFAPLIFLDGFSYSLLGMVLWGIGLGAQESIMRAAVATMVPMEKRGTAYGVMNMVFGLTWFLGSAFMGFLYDLSLPLLILFSFGVQLAAIPLLMYVERLQQKK